jgi:hypothetical protein
MTRGISVLDRVGFFSAHDLREAQGPYAPFF